MTDPVICADGHTYERVAIEQWFQQRSTSPLTNQELCSLELVPNYALKHVIEKTLKILTLQKALLVLTPRQLLKALMAPTASD